MLWIPPTDDSYSIVKQSAFIQWVFKCLFSAVFCRYPISISPLKKLYTVHSNKLAESYTLISVTIFIDKYGGGEFKTRRFSRSSQKLDHFLKQNNQLSPKVQQLFKNDFMHEGFSHKMKIKLSSTSGLILQI